MQSQGFDWHDNEVVGILITTTQILTVVKEFYAKVDEAIAFAQQPVLEICDNLYAGMQSENDGVISVLEVIESDFDGPECDIKAVEDSALKE